MEGIIKKLGGWSGVAIILTAVLGIGFILILAARKPAEPPLDTVLSKVAKETGVNEEQLRKDMNSTSVKKIVDDEKADMTARFQALGENPGTPAVFINGERINLTSLQSYPDAVAAAINKDGATLPVLLEVFSDYNCSHCAALEPYSAALKTKYSSAQLTIQQKHFPFLRTSSTNYAYAAEAARLQGKFDEFNRKLFEAIQGTLQEVTI